MSQTELSLIARQGSGSACRSMLGGYVAWRMGSAADGGDSVAQEVAPASHWPDMHALILVVSDAKKGVSSTAGMQQTVATSSLFQQRVSTVVPEHMKRMELAIEERDFAAFAEITMRDSNSFHATCADTYPPIYYMNDVSRAAVRAVEALNEAADGKTIAAYTFDAGPNAVIYYLKENADAVIGTLSEFFRSSNVQGWKSHEGSGIRGAPLELKLLRPSDAETLRTGVSRVIMTGIGPGPLESSEHLVTETGVPIALASQQME
jgi:diphosphomevalonate decarboxylase